MIKKVLINQEGYCLSILIWKFNYYVNKLLKKN